MSSTFTRGRGYRGSRSTAVAPSTESTRSSASWNPSRPWPRLLVRRRQTLLFPGHPRPSLFSPSTAQKVCIMSVNLCNYVPFLIYKPSLKNRQDLDSSLGQCCILTYNKSSFAVALYDTMDSQQKNICPQYVCQSPIASFVIASHLYKAAD